MNDVINFPPRDGRPYATAECNPNEPLPVNLPEGMPQMEVGNLGFEDVGAAFNMRDWLQKACEARGAKMVGGGFGMGQADIDIDLEGCRFNISIRPLPRS